MSLGGKQRENITIQEELAIFRAYSAEIRAIMPINTEEKARQYRAILVKDNPKLKNLFRNINLS